MRFEDFCQQDSPNRSASIKEHGLFLAMRTKYDYNIALYHMGDFFAEIWFSSDTDKIILVKGFKRAHYLEPYLAMIELANMV